MIPIKNISRYTCLLAISLLLGALPADAQRRKAEIQEPDTTAFFKGFAVSADLIGPLQLLLSDYGQYEAALRINLKDRWFPVFELGLGKASHDDIVTKVSYKTSAPYGRVGLDFNLLKNKHDIYRLYGGFRYAYTNYKCDISRDDMEDPVWKTKSSFSEEGISCYQHWLEGVFGIDASIMGPFHLGWTVRYKRRLMHKEGDIGNTWYVPGFGVNDTDNLTLNFNVIIDI